MSEAVLSSTERKELRQVITASSVGTLIEWYDFFAFGVLASVIGLNFFPKENETAGFLLTLATFATGFIVRPFGAIFFGWLGDIVGRKHTFLVTLVMMGGSTFLVGCLPTYAMAGILAPILLVVLRLVQGLALGGEYGGAATYVAEHSPTHRRGFYTSFIQTTATLGLFCALGVILKLQTMLGQEAFQDWGWRVPFLVSILLIVVSYFIRRRLSESPVFAKLKAEGRRSTNPIRDSFMNKENRRWVLIALFGATAGQGVIWYTGQFHALYFLEKDLGIDSVATKLIMGAALLLATPLFLVFGHLSDKIGRKKLMMAGILLGALTYLPIYIAMGAAAGADLWAAKPVPSNPNYVLLTLLVFIQVVFVTMVYGPIAAFLVELFPTKVRYTSMSLPYHIGNGVFGGLVPFIAKATTESTGNRLLGLAYPIGVALITVVVGAIFIRERFQTSLED